MNSELEKLERLIEQKAQILAHLPALEPSPECLARLEELVRHEARRSARTFRLVLSVGVAAAILLAAFLLPTLGIWRRPAAEAEDAAGIGLWAEAVDQSNSALAFLLEEGWLTDIGVETDVDHELETLFESFEQTFNQFGHL